MFYNIFQYVSDVMHVYVNIYKYTVARLIRFNFQRNFPRKKGSEGGFAVVTSFPNLILFVVYTRGIIVAKWRFLRSRNPAGKLHRSAAVRNERRSGGIPGSEVPTLGWKEGGGGERTRQNPLVPKRTGDATASIGMSKYRRWCRQEIRQIFSPYSKPSNSVLHYRRRIGRQFAKVRIHLSSAKLRFIGTVTCRRLCVLRSVTKFIERFCKFVLSILGRRYVIFFLFPPVRTVE